MSRVSVKKLMEHARANKYAVGYFESWSLESTLAVVRAAENKKSPVMIGFCGTYLGEKKRKYKESVTVYASMLSQIAEEATVPVGILLNEADDEEMVIQAIKSGFDMVMFAPVFAAESDALSLSEMLQIQKRIVEEAHKYDVAVEGEVGELPLFNSVTGEMHEGEDTDPDICRDFVIETGVDTVAVSVGNCHLKENGFVTINYPALKDLAEKVEIPLVLHGGTSIDKEDLKKVSQMGVAKVNFGTGMKRTVLNTLKTYMSNYDLDLMDPNDVLGRGGDKDILVLEQEVIIEYVETIIQAMHGENMAF